MIRIHEVKLPIDHDQAALTAALLSRLDLPPEDLLDYTLHKRSLDSRKKTDPRWVYIVDATVRDEAAVLKRFKKDPHVTPTPDMTYKMAAQAPRGLKTRPIVIGAGPCGIFAALMLARMGFKPLILERGKNVRDRTKDTFGFWRLGQDLNPESNAQFGEGGAGTFSDGKLYSQIRDPQHYGRKVLQEFVAAGANPEILYVNRPHIGTYRLVAIVQKLRETILSLGGEFRFESKVTDLDIVDGRIRGVILADGTRLESDHVVLAIGHSARDTFQMLHARGVYIEPKPFSIGFRVEHPQELIDRARYGPYAGSKLLGAADYKLVHHCQNGRSVYSFCMCPGGLVVAAASEPGRLVTNGMSQYARDEQNANAAIVVGISPEDFPSDHPLAGVELQRRLEEGAYKLAGNTYHAPVQKVGDFLAGRPTTALGTVKPSYRPGVTLSDLSNALPEYAITAIREAMPAFDRQIKGFAMDDALFTGVETRTSSPIRIKRGDDFQSLNTRGLFPAGEGAGYAGGILSSAIDGLKVAEAVALSMLKDHA